MKYSSGINPLHLIHLYIWIAIEKLIVFMELETLKTYSKKLILIT